MFKLYISVFGQQKNCWQIHINEKQPTWAFLSLSCIFRTCWMLVINGSNKPHHCSWINGNKVNTTNKIKWRKGLLMKQAITWVDQCRKQRFISFLCSFNKNPQRSFWAQYCNQICREKGDRWMEITKPSGCMWSRHLKLTPNRNASQNKPRGPVWQIFDENKSHQCRNQDQIGLLKNKWTFPVNANQPDNAKIPDDRSESYVIHGQVPRFQNFPTRINYY